MEADMFGKSFIMNVGGENGGQALPSKMGSICTIALLIILISYAGYKVSVMQGKKSVDIV